MPKSEYTKGPWAFTKDGRVKGPQGNTICDARYKNLANDGPVLAASPDLLEAALDFLHGYCDEPAKEFHDRLSDLAFRFRMATNKAEAK